MSWRQVFCPVETRENSRGEIWLADATEADLSVFAGQAHCVYIDPPFYTGESFLMRQRWGEKGWETGKDTIELKAYDDIFESKADYLAFLRALIEKAHTLLDDTGAFFLHLDTRMDAYARILCDEIFGDKNFVNQIVWSYQSGGRSMKRFSRKHDLILFYQKSKDLRFDLTTVPIPREGNRQNHMRRTVDENGRACRTIKSGGKTYVYYDDEPCYPGDVWSDLSHLQQKDPQRTGYDTQKPQALLERVIKPTTVEGDLAVDLCCGSGTLPVTAALLRRRFLALDIGMPAVAVTRKRLISAKVPFTLRAPSEVNSSSVDADILMGIAFYDVCLSGFTTSLDLPGQLNGLDAVDQWSVGYYENGHFLAYADSVRQKQTPELSPVLQLPLLSGTPAIMIVDVAGNRYCYALDEE